MRRSFAGRGLNPRPERSTHAKTVEQRTKKQTKRFISGVLFRIWNYRRHLAGVELSGRGFNPRPAQDRLLSTVY